MRLLGKHGCPSCAVGVSERAQPAQSAPAQQAKPEPAPVAQQAEDDSMGPSEAPEEESWVYLDPANREQVMLLKIQCYQTKRDLQGPDLVCNPQEIYGNKSDMLNPLDSDKCHAHLFCQRPSLPLTTPRSHITRRRILLLPMPAFSPVPDCTEIIHELSDRQSQLIRCLRLAAPSQDICRVRRDLFLALRYWRGLMSSTSTTSCASGLQTPRMVLSGNCQSC